LREGLQHLTTGRVGEGGEDEIHALGLLGFFVELCRFAGPLVVPAARTSFGLDSPI